MAFSSRPASQGGSLLALVRRSCSTAVQLGQRRRAFGRRLLSDGGLCREGLMPRFLVRGWLLSLPFCVWR